MNPTIITAAQPVVDLPRAKLQCKITTDARDAELIDAIATAQAWVQDWTGVAIGPQRLSWTFYEWGSYVVLPYDITSVVSVKADGADVPWTRSNRTIMAPTDARPVEIVIDCGLTVAALPPPMKSAMLLVIADLIANPQAQVQQQLYENAAVERLLSLHRERLPL